MGKSIFAHKKLFTIKAYKIFFVASMPFWLLPGGRNLLRHSYSFIFKPGWADDKIIGLNARSHCQNKIYTNSIIRLAWVKTDMKLYLNIFITHERPLCQSNSIKILVKASAPSEKIWNLRENWKLALQRIAIRRFSFLLTRIDGTTHLLDHVF